MKNILSKTRNKFYPLFAIIISALTALSSCDKNDDTFFNEIPDIDNPFEILPDPEGTIQLSMRDDDNGKTLLDNIYISDENFASNYVWPGNPVTFVSLGNMSGLANVNQIPTAGWASKVAVVPGNGYIAYDSSKDTYYRLYITNYIVSTTGGIIGADVKYQMPFYGKDEAILPETESLTFPANGGMQTVVFKNQEVIPFDIETDVSWCSVQKASTNDNSFLANAIAITVEGSSDTEAATGKITLKTKYGKETVINITRSGEEPFITLNPGSSFIAATATGAAKLISFESNIEQEDLTVTSSAAWCKAVFTKAFGLSAESDLQTKSNEIKFIGDKPVSEIDENLSLYASVTKYLSVTVEENSSTQSREATITIQSNDKKVSSKFKIIQSGIVLEVKINTVNFDKNSNSRTITINTSASNWDAESSESWCTFSKNGNQITIMVTASTTDRTAVISFKGFDTQITVHQSKYAVGDSYNENGIEGTVGYIGDGGRYIYRDLGKAAWSTEEVATGANSSTDGEYNMEVIKRIPYWQDLYPAFLLCDRLNTNGISGWYLPAIYELVLIVDLIVDLIDSSDLCSSTEYSNTKAYYYSYPYNRLYYKSSEHQVYAVHKF